MDKLKELSIQYSEGLFTSREYLCIVASAISLHAMTVDIIDCDEMYANTLAIKLTNEPMTTAEIVKLCD